MSTTTLIVPRAGAEAAPPPRATLTVETIGDFADIAHWRNYTSSAADATLFHEPSWCTAVVDAFGHMPLHLAARRGGETVGILPLFAVNSVLGGRLLVSVPYGTYGGIVAADEEARAALASAALHLAGERGARCLELRSSVAAVPEVAIDRRYLSFVRELPESCGALETYLPRKARAAARQAREREFLTVRHDSADDRQMLRLVWGLYARSMRRLGSINYPYRFFVALARELGARIWLTTVWQRRRPLAGLLSFVFRDTVMPYFVGLDERTRCTGVTNLLYFALMERTVERGLQRFDFGRSRRTNIGSITFKRNQGFLPATLEYQRYVPGGGAAPNLTPDNPRLAVARRVWRHLPLALTTRLGAWLARAIPG